MAPTILIVSHTVLGAGIYAVLDRMPNYTILATPSTRARDVADLIQDRHPTLSILDATSIDILEWLQQIGRDRAVHLGPTIAITPRPPDEETFFFLMKWGCFACLTARISNDALVETVLKVAQGECLLSSAILAPPPAPSFYPQAQETFCDVESTLDELINPLTPREREVLLLLSNCKSNKEISRLLTLSDQTVKHHLTAILRKLECRNRTQAVYKWMCSRQQPHTVVA